VNATPAGTLWQDNGDGSRSPSGMVNGSTGLWGFDYLNTAVVAVPNNGWSDSYWQVSGSDIVPV
jgi:hypothetical protein